jgi:hypothetical protein
MTRRSNNWTILECAALSALVLSGCAAGGGGVGSPSIPSAAPSSSSASPPSTSASTASGTKTGAPSTGADTPGAGAGPSVKTPDERRAEADRKLDASLGTFDDQLRKEQARIARDREARANARIGGAIDGDGTADGTDGGDGRRARGRRGDGDMRSDKEHREERGEHRDGDMKSDPSGKGGPGAPGSNSKGPGNNVPEGVGSGENDDLVAKQLREAAEKETDPELRDKLWKEYQDYKKSVKRN